MIIMSTYGIFMMLRQQASLRSQENDVAGVLLKLSEELAKEAHELEGPELWTEQQKEYDLAAAKQSDPDGATCGWCGKPNDFADDCGWFCCDPLPGERMAAGEGPWEFGKNPSDFRYTCRACYFGGVGEKHRAFYGESDR